MSPPRLLPLADGGELLLLDPWLPPAEAAAFLAALQAELPWEQKPIQIMGKRILQPRLVAWIGDPDAVYTYSGVQNHPLPWTATLLPLRRRVVGLRPRAAPVAGHVSHEPHAGLPRPDGVEARLVGLARDGVGARLRARGRAERTRLSADDLDHLGAAGQDEHVVRVATVDVDERRDRRQLDRRQRHALHRPERLLEGRSLDRGGRGTRRLRDRTRRQRGRWRIGRDDG